MSAPELCFSAIGKRDGVGDDYYFTCPRLPCFIDLSKVVIFFRPWENDKTGQFGLDITVKEYTPRRKKEDAPTDKKEDVSSSKNNNG